MLNDLSGLSGLSGLLERKEVLRCRQSADDKKKYEQAENPPDEAENRQKRAIKKQEEK